MTDFKAPPVPPYEPDSTPVAAPADPAAAPVVPGDNMVSPETPHPTEQKAGAALQENIQKLRAKTDELHQQFSALPDSKRNLIIYLGVFMVGLLLGWLFFGGSCPQNSVAPRGLTGVVTNPDMKTKLSRCGTVASSEACVLYVMNSYTYDKLVEDFYETAVALTQRPDFLIKSDNVRYGKTHIPPGYFAEIKIPMKR